MRSIPANHRPCQSRKQGSQDAAALEGLIAACQDPLQAQDAVLERILQASPAPGPHDGGADGGADGGGGAGASFAAALDHLPLTTYADYQPAVEAALAAAAAGDAAEVQRLLRPMRCGQPVTGEYARRRPGGGR